MSRRRRRRRCSARAAWSALASPGTPSPGRSSALLGAADALGWVRARRRGAGPDARRRSRTARPARRRRPDGGSRGPSRGGPSGCPTATRAATSSTSTGSGGTLLRAGRPSVAGRARRPRGRGAVLPVGPRRRRTSARSLARSVAVVGSRAATAYGERVAFDLADGLARPGVVRGLRRRVRHRRGGAPRRRRARRPHASSSSRAASTAPTRRATPRCSRRSWAPAARVVSRGAAGQPADQEPVPAAQPADRRGRPGDGRGRGGVAVGRDEHRAPRGAAAAARRRRAGAGDVDGLGRLPPAAAGGRRGVRHRRGRGARARGRHRLRRWRPRPTRAADARRPAQDALDPVSPARPRRALAPRCRPTLDRVASLAGVTVAEARGARRASWSSPGGRSAGVTAGSPRRRSTS